MRPDPAAEIRSAAPIADASFSVELRALLDRANGQAMTMEEIERSLPESTTYGMLMVFFALPFSLPVSIPGISTPFGLAIICIGICLVAGVHPWLPRRARGLSIGYERLKNIVDKGTWMARQLERLIKRGRLAFLVDSRFSRRFLGAMVVSSGFYLGLPLPIPFTNTIPAYSLIFLAIGWMEGDGLFVVIGYILGVAAWLYVIGLWLAGSSVFTGLWERWFG